jgi:hypothetical protein
MRDLEILRTLARMHFVTSGLLNGAFFPSESVGFRRLRALAKRDFIRRHTKGAATRTNYCAWRLSPRGIGKVRDEFRHEPMAENLDNRLTDHSLADLEHRELLSRVYLALIAGERGLRGERDQTWRGVQLWLAAVRERAEQIAWRPTGDVVLRYHFLGRDHAIVPDVTIEAPRASTRIFLDVDHSERAFPRIERTIERYGDFIRGVYNVEFKDSLTPWVVYLARSEGRLTGVARLGRRYLEGVCRWRVARYEEGAGWLAELLYGEKRPVLEHSGDQASRLAIDPTSSALHTAAYEVLRSTNELVKHSPAEFNGLGRSQAARMTRWREDMRALYRLLKEDEHGR